MSFTNKGEILKEVLIRDIVFKIPQIAVMTNRSKIILAPPKPLFHKDFPIVLYWSPKSGCTAATKWFFHQLGLLEEALEYHFWVHNYKSQVFFEAKNYNNNLIKKILNPRTIVVKIVRNPFSRIVSSYLAINDRGGKSQKSWHRRERRKIFEFLQTEDKDENSFTFRDFVAYLRASRSREMHLASQIHPSEKQRYVNIDILIKVENLREGLLELERKFSLKETNFDKLFKSGHHVNYKDNSKELCCDKVFPFLRPADYPVPSYQNFYDEELMKTVSEIYAEEFKRYGYSTEIV